jgi:hypothetical protein
MMRVLTATCIAAACAVGLSAQQPPTSSTTGSGATTTAQSGQGGRMAGPMTITGCVEAGDTAGTYRLTHVEGMPMGRRGGEGASTTTAPTGTAGETSSGAATTTAGGATTTAGAQGGGRGPMSVMLNASSDVNLSAHVGHKVEVTGTMAGGRGGQGGAGATTTGGAATTTGETSAAGSTAGTTGQGGGRGMRALNVTAVKMISTDCGK